MRKIGPDDPIVKGAGHVPENIARPKALFPELVTEGATGVPVDAETLKALMGGATVTDSEEKYGLDWPGKRRARQMALTASAGTLRPVPEESVDWATTRNLLIEGDNLEVLKLLQKSYGGRVKAIYIDPPYNTGRNLLYRNDYADGVRTYLQGTGRLKNGPRLVGDPESGGRLHSNWLSMIYPRLQVAKSLLRPDGVLFCTIDENEFATLALVLKELFGEGEYEHAYVTIVHNPRGQQGTNISYVHENAIIVYPADNKKYLADMSKNEVDARNLRDGGTESDRTDARNCFYPFIVKDKAIVGIGDVPKSDFHPASANIKRNDGSIEVWPITDAGDEKKWRYARNSVENILGSLEPKMGRTSVQIIFNKASGTMRSVWQSARYDASEYGTKVLEALIPGNGFTFPKSLWAVYDAIKLMTEDDPDAIVLDFFAGSGTTGHAVMQLNKDTGGKRRFVLVQLPELLDENDREQADAVRFCRSRGRPSTIAEITKERLREVAAKIRAEDAARQCDVGFRVFRLHAQNVGARNPSRADTASSPNDEAGNIKGDGTEADILAEILLELGLDLCVPIETRDIAGKEVHLVGGGILVACLATIGQGEVEALALGIAEWHAELVPAGEVTIVFRDAAFADDAAKSHLAAILDQHGLKNIRSL